MSGSEESKGHSRVTAALALAALLSGCGISIPFSVRVAGCGSDADCPVDQTCVERTCRATDDAGRPTLDAGLLALTFAITSPATGDLTTRFATLAVSGTCSTSAMDLTTSQGSFADADCADGTWSLEPYALAEGANAFTLTASDSEGHLVSVTLVARLDTTPPAVAITAPSSAPDLLTNTRSQVVSGTCSRDVATLETTLGSLADSDCADGTWSLAPYLLAAGDNAFTVTATDATGNTSSDRLVVHYDAVPPAVAITAPNSGSDLRTNAQVQTVSGTCSNDTVALSVSKGTLSDGDCTDGRWSLAPFTLALGDNLFTVTAADTADNLANDAVTLTYDPPPAHVAITSPWTAPPELVTTNRRVTLSGTCDPDVVALTTSHGAFADRDCSDGGWSLAPFDFVKGRTTVTVSATDSTGNTGSGSYTVNYVYVLVTRPDRPPAFFTNVSPQVVSGACSTEVRSLTTTLGAVADADCADATWSLAPFAFSAEGDFAFSVTAADALGASDSAALTLTYDVVAPASPSLNALTAPRTQFPVLTGAAEPKALVMLYKDAACAIPVGWDTAEKFAGAGITLGVPPGLTTLHARTMDRAGNVSACVHLADHTAGGAGLPPCDVHVTRDLSFVELRAVLDSANTNRAAYLADGAIAVCLASGITVRTTSAAEGERLNLPADVYLFAPTGRASIRNERMEPGVGELTASALWTRDTNLGFANLDVYSARGSALLSNSQTTKIAFLRSMRLESHADSAFAVYAGATEPALVAEITDSVFEQYGSAPAVAVGVWTRVNLFARNRIVLRGSGSRGLDLSYWGNSAPAINDGALVSEVLDTVIEAHGAGNTGIQIAETRLNAIGRLSNTEVRLAADAPDKSGVAILFAGMGLGRGYVATANVTGNRLCTDSATADWAFRLGTRDGAYWSGTQEFTGPTVPFDLGAYPSTTGPSSFPWGDASHAATNPGFNLQAQWGGRCP